MAVHTIEWRISEHLLGVDRMNWDQVMDCFLHDDFRTYFHEVYFHVMLWPSYFCSRVNPYASF